MGQSLFDVSRQLTPEEWGELKAWRAANPELRWKRGDVREDGLVFYQYDARAKSGEAWTTRERYDRYTLDAKARAARNYARDPLPARERSLRRYRDNKDLVLRKSREYAARNKGALLKARKEWLSRPEVKEGRRAYMREYMRNRSRNDPGFAALIRLRSRHKRAVGGGRESDKIASGFVVWQMTRLGLSPEDMTCWQIDHVVPLSLAVANKSIEPQITHWTNLLVVPAAFNLRKGDQLPSYGYLRYRDSLVEEYLQVLG